MPTKWLLDLLGFRLDATKAEGLAFSINIETPDNGERYVLELSNAALTNVRGYRDPDADMTVRVRRSGLDLFIMGQTSIAALAAEDKALPIMPEAR